MTMYISLEPCCHQGRTGPCTEAIIESGIKKVIIAMLDPNPIVKGKGVKLLKKNGLMFVATINKTLKSYIFAIVGAEYILRWLPIGTHEWEKFVKPEDLKKILMKYDLSLNKLEGMNFNIIKDEWNISRDLSVNYIAKFIKN